jgi:hypothetical protein
MTVCVRLDRGEKEYFQAGQKGPETRRAKVRERRRTLQYVDAKRAERNEVYGPLWPACGGKR